MKRRTETAVAALDDSLQADVMRFMAIIAFCLVAIMALARNAAPLEAEAAASAPKPVASEQAADLPAPPTEPALQEPVAAPLPRPSAAPALAAEVVEARAPDPVETVGAPEETPAVAIERASPPPVPRVDVPAPADDVAIAEPPPAPVPAPEAADAEPVEEGLSLRFASDGDFLRLVSREAIEVFAFREGEVLALSPGLRFATTRAPGQVHELLPATIPAPIADALAEARDDAASFAWGVRMPGRIERRVRDHVDAGDSGVLVIDRFGEVRLVTARNDEERNG